VSNERTTTARVGENGPGSRSQDLRCDARSSGLAQRRARFGFVGCSGSVPIQSTIARDPSLLTIFRLCSALKKG
jgi:hypothetical protein